VPRDSLQKDTSFSFNVAAVVRSNQDKFRHVFEMHIHRLKRFKSCKAQMGFSDGTFDAVNLVFDRLESQGWFLCGHLKSCSRLRSVVQG